MDFKSLLGQLSQLSEATKETPTGRVHKAEPGGYGRKFDTDDEGDEKKEKKPEVKRGRGRPKKGADDSGEVKSYGGAKELQSFMIGNVPKKGLPSKPGKKHTLKDWVEQVEAKYVAEAIPGQQLTVKPMPGAAQLVDPASNKVMATGDAAAIKNMQGAVSQGKVQMRVGAEDMAEDGGEKWIQKAIKHPGAFTKKAQAAGKSVAAFAKEKAHAPGTLGKQARLAQTLKKINKESVAEGDIPSDQTDMGAGLGAGRNAKTLESKKAKPDFLDLDKDGNKQESMKKAADDKKKKKVNESGHRHSAARLSGKAHALAKEAYNCKYDDIEEARMYHEGFKEGLDECYGQGVYEMAPATTGGMAQQAMEADMDEGNAFTAALARTPQGEKFSVGGKTFTDRTSYDSKIDEFTFESLDKQLNELLKEDSVSEGMTVSISKGQQGAPDSVTVSAQDAEADQLLGLIKQAGLGLFGDNGVDKIAPANGDDIAHAHGDINVVDDHDGMMSLIKRLAGTGAEEQHSDYEDEGHEEHGEEGHEHVDEQTCNECGMMESQCECDQETVDETESYNQEEEQVAETNQPDSGASETSADERAEAEEDVALAVKEHTQFNEWANDAGKKSKDFKDESFTTTSEFMTKTISGGLNKPKSTGQTTIPVVAGQMNRMISNESIIDYKKLAGIK